MTRQRADAGLIGRTYPAVRGPHKGQTLTVCRCEWSDSGHHVRIRAEDGSTWTTRTENVRVMFEKMDRGESVVK